MPSDQFTPSLLRWFATHGRDLPWRHTRDPYPIWLSEVILQQTRIAQGEAYWHRFLQLFPTVEDLAAAPQDAVMRAWQGLGYYSRARNLHAAAKQVVAMGGFPTTVEGLRALKGVGAYTAAAIASFAYDLPVAVVDGNVYRVLARHYGIDTAINTTAGQHTFAELAQSLIDPSRPGEYNQAIMDFGALQCAPRAPHCDVCPMLEHCEAARSGTVDQLPVKLKLTRIRDRHFTIIFVRHAGEIALMRRGAGDIWQGLWQPLLLEGDTPWPTLDGTRTLLAHDIHHILTHQRLTADAWLVDTTTRPTLPTGYRWVPESTLPDYALPRLFTRLLPCLGVRH